jgi:hypothetical protein
MMDDLTNLDDGWVLFTAFHEFIICELGILVAIHSPEDLVHSLRIIVNSSAGVLT